MARRMGRRLKVPGRGWCIENLEGMAALIATVDTPEWDDLWTRPAALLPESRAAPSPRIMRRPARRRRSARSAQPCRQSSRRHVEVRKAWMPRDWPRDKFDLIVLSEFLFYLQSEAVEEIARKAQETLVPGGAILACHWRHPIAHCAMTGDDVHATLQRCIHLPHQGHVVEPDLRLDVWSSRFLVRCCDPAAARS